jgi:transcriptional regulator with XRE-family HTH domain
MIALEDGKDTAKHNEYYFGMASKRHRPLIASSVSKNLRVLLDLTMDGNQSELARQSGVSQRHISDIINGRTECTYPIAAALAAPFGLIGWHLQLPDLPKDLVASPAIARLVAAYIDADDAGREFMDAAARREAKRKP